MAKEDTVTIPVSTLEALEARLALLELAEKQRAEAAINPHAIVLDSVFEAWKVNAARPASERTQEIADKRYRGPKRFKVRLDSTSEDGKPGPVIKEHFPLEISAHSDLEASARYQEIMGIRRHDYQLRAELVSAA